MDFGRLVDAHQRGTGGKHLPAMELLFSSIFNIFVCVCGDLVCLAFIFIYEEVALKVRYIIPEKNKQQLINTGTVLAVPACPGSNLYLDDFISPLSDSFQPHLSAA